MFELALHQLFNVVLNFQSKTESQELADFSSVVHQAFPKIFKLKVGVKAKRKTIGEDCGLGGKW